MTSDGAKLKQCLINLLSNAAKFTQQGTVTLRVSQDGELRRLRRHRHRHRAHGRPARAALRTASCRPRPAPPGASAAPGSGRHHPPPRHPDGRRRGRLLDPRPGGHFHPAAARGRAAPPRRAALTQRSRDGILLYHGHDPHHTSLDVPMAERERLLLEAQRLAGLGFFRSDLATGDSPGRTKTIPLMDLPTARRSRKDAPAR